MARIAAFLDHDITIRHFALNGLLSALDDRHDVVTVFPHAHKRVRTDVARLGLARYRTLPVSAERVYLYRRLYHATVIRKVRRTRDRVVGMKFWRDSLGPVAFAKSWLASWPVAYELYRRRVAARMGPNEALDTFLDQERPDVILHPTVLEGLFVSDLVRAGQARGIPTVFVMNSWDNPAAKAMMVGHPDRLVVWGEQTKQHAVEFLGTPPDRVVSLGAAQFDVYRRPPKIAPAEYREKLGVGADTRILLYAGSSKGLDEMRHLAALDEAATHGTLGRAVVLYRPHPWRAAPPTEVDFFGRRWTHVVMDPAMEASYRASRERPGLHVELADYEDTHVTLSAVDAVVSPLSTILLEAAMHGKPIAAYLPDEDMTRNRFLFAAANMAHFTDFFARVDCLRCESPARLVDDCARLLALGREPGRAERLRAQCAHFVEPSNRPYVERLEGLIVRVAARRAGATGGRG